MSNNFHPLSSTDSNLIENSWSGFGLTPDLPRRDMILSSRSPSASSSDSMDSLSTIIDQGSRGKIQNYFIMTWSKIEWKDDKQDSLILFWIVQRYMQNQTTQTLTNPRKVMRIF